MNRYEIFLEVCREGSFTKVAQKYGYSQSAISQMIKSVEKELGTTLLNRSKMVLTQDGKTYLPYIENVVSALDTLSHKKQEVLGLEQSTIRIGTFASISRYWLPQWIQSFHERYPHTRFELIQGEYANISAWIHEGKIDFGFVNADMVTDLELQVIYEDRMVAILPKDHPLGKESSLSLSQLLPYPFIELDEGPKSVPMQAFKRMGKHPNVQYKVYDDASIVEMVRAHLGISIMYEQMIGSVDDVVLIPIDPPLIRKVALAWENKDILSHASREFIQTILNSKDIKI